MSIFMKIAALNVELYLNKLNTCMPTNIKTFPMKYGAKAFSPMVSRSLNL